MARTLVEFIKVAKLSEVPRNRELFFSVEDTGVLLLNVDDRICAINKVCPHQDLSVLHQGSLEESQLTCPMHG